MQAHDPPLRYEQLLLGGVGALNRLLPLLFYGTDALLINYLDDARLPLE
jgi:hypothetical protein